jgi:hypothetical protein
MTMRRRLPRGESRLASFGPERSGPPSYPHLEIKELKMPDHHTTAITGKVTHVFGHRFVIETHRGAVLADLTPKGAEQHSLRVGEVVNLRGEMKPSELKVSHLTAGKTTITIEHKKKPHDHHPHAEPGAALKAAREAGFEPVGEPRRKPKHFEVLGRRHDRLTELHIELDGHIRKMKPVEGTDAKWSGAL